MLYNLFFIISFFLWHLEVFAQHVLIYADRGVYYECLEQTRQNLSRELSEKYIIRAITAEDLMSAEVISNTSLIVFPGGVATAFAERLNGEGNKLIRNFVESGGGYLGLCGGGYYAGAFVDFARGTELALKKSHELAFFSGTVVGPALKSFDYFSCQGECIAEVSIHHSDYLLDNAKLYCNGGGYFENASNFANTSVIASYKTLENTPAAIIKVKVEQGIAILSGVHFEYESNVLKRIDANCDVSEIELTRQRLLRYVLTLFNLELRPEPQASTIFHQ